jgi:hypothetical protein
VEGRDVYVKERLFHAMGILAEDWVVARKIRRLVYLLFLKGAFAE